MYEQEMLQRGFVFLSGATGVMGELHQHREVEVNLVVEGELTYLFGGSLETLPAGQVAIFWAMIPHQAVHIVPGTRSFRIHLPLARFFQWDLPSKFISGLLHGKIMREPDASWATRDDQIFEQWRVDLEVPSTDANQIVLLELEARIRRLARSVSLSSDKAPANDLTSTMRDRSFDKVEQMAVYIIENYQKRITTSDIAAAAGLHPKYAMTLFRDRCGLTIGEYLAQQRISQAQRLLATTEKKIVDVAFTSGFGSVSQFYEVFTRHCHQSPKDFRWRQKQYYGRDGGKVVLGD